VQQDSPQYCHRGIAVEYVNLLWDNNLKVTYLFQHHIRPQRESPSSLARKAIARSSNVREVDGAPHADFPFDVRAPDWTKVVLYHQTSRTARRSWCCNHRSRTAVRDSLSTLV